MKMLRLRWWKEKNFTVQDSLLSKIPPLAATLIGSYTHSYKITGDEHNISPKYYEAQFISLLRLDLLYHGGPKLSLQSYFCIWIINKM